MADNTKIVLDKAGLQSFIDHQIIPFSDALDKVANKVDEHGTPTMQGILGLAPIPDSEKHKLYAYRSQVPLMLGQVASSNQDQNTTGGPNLAQAVTNAATSIDKVYTQQIKLFKDLHTYLAATIKNLMDAQHDSLTKIDGKAFLDALGLVPNDFSGGTGTGTGTAA
ncbi:type VII secretion system-associated protein [Actinoallomurus spadix]|uniref:Type VII secretion system-associated protein n=1 Tax=Actinoallomurus spadix TaxID=79912 RepID=A0ABP3FWW6_9ACTN|nr:type VII secretion system-associated protein [Actinoallomurus spadix]MCO5988459.1 type VII secretion system-associated protein [Actinoallomurus spadix]